MFARNATIRLQDYTVSVAVFIANIAELIRQPTQLIPEDGGRIFRQKFGIRLQVYTASQ
jgi:hypothetical protein